MAWALAVCVSATVWQAGARAASGEAAPVDVELNKIEPHDGACRAYLVLKNKTANGFKTLKFDLVMFDTEGIVAKRLAVEAGPLPAGKTSLKVFDVGDLPCDRLGRILLNDVMACEDATGPREDCLAFVATSARAKVPFIK